MELFKLLGTIAISGADIAKDDIDGISDKAEKCPKCGIKKGEKVPVDEYAKEEVVALVCDENSKKVVKRISKKCSSLKVLIVLAFISIGGIVYYFSGNKEELVELYPDFYKKIRKNPLYLSNEIT